MVARPNNPTGNGDSEANAHCGEPFATARKLQRGLYTGAERLHLRRRCVLRIHRGDAAAALWQSTVLEAVAPDRSPLISPPEQRDVGKAYANYLASLKQLADVLNQTRLNPMDLPVTEGAAQETESLAPVLAFLSERRFQLRRLIHASANQQMIESSCAEMGADRGDQITALYHTTVLGVELPEEPENWTLRDKLATLFIRVRACCVRGF